MYREAESLVLFCVALAVFVVLSHSAFAQSAPAVPDMKNVTVESGGTAVIAPVTVNVPRPQTIVVPAPVVRVAAPTVNVAPAQVNIPEELKVRSVGASDVDVAGNLDINIKSMPDLPEPQSWCVRNLGWCGLLGAAIIGASVGVADAAGAFDNNVTFK